MRKSEIGLADKLIHLPHKAAGVLLGVVTLVQVYVPNGFIPLERKFNKITGISVTETAPAALCGRGESSVANITFTYPK
ncbi:MAG: hypothetical protein U9N73_11265 [Candidatus Auribacterota bacterium]|nr:hypothetical protein [Candidatus Auribacterota bacterium]